MLDNKVYRFMNNFRHGVGFKRDLFLIFGKYEWCRKLLGGKFELWVLDKGLSAVLSWQWVHEWTDQLVDNCDYVIAKRVYVKGKSLTTFQAKEQGLI